MINNLTNQLLLHCPFVAFLEYRGFSYPVAFCIPDVADTIHHRKPLLRPSNQYVPIEQL